MLAGMTRSLARCHPAWSMTNRTWTSGARVLEKSSRKRILGVGFWHDQGEVGAGGRAHGGEKVGGLEAPVTQPEGTLAAQPPAMGASPLLTDPGFILEPDLDALAGMKGGGFHQLGGKPAFFEGFLSLRIAFGVLGTRFLAR